jgi:DNA-binding transcriptional MerR regulator
MTSLVLHSPDTRTLVCIASSANAAYSLQAISRLTGVHPDLLGYYHQLGLIDAVSEDPVLGLVFERAALDEIRRIEHYRRNLGVQRKALPLMCDLWREGERLHIELNFLRAP